MRRYDLTLQRHLRYIRYIAAEGGNVVPESMKQKSKTIFPNDIVAKSRVGTNTLQRLNATSTFTLHLTPDQDNTSQNAFVIIIIPARRSLVPHYTKLGYYTNAHITLNWGIILMPTLH